MIVKDILLLPTSLSDTSMGSVSGSLVMMSTRTTASESWTEATARVVGKFGVGYWQRPQFRKVHTPIFPQDA